MREKPHLNCAKNPGIKREGSSTMTKYILVCGNCGAENERNYLPEKFRCSSCGECFLTEEWREKVKEAK